MPIGDSGEMKTARAPPSDQPIFGEQGIMHGAVMKRNPRLDWLTDIRYQKRNFKVYGYNGLSPGGWWPYFFLALFNGAHGHSQAGITGNDTSGAWSIVASGAYR
jgi:hypothetical protein